MTLVQSCLLPLPLVLQVLSCKEFRLQSVVEAAMEIAGLQAAQKRLQVRERMRVRSRWHAFAGIEHELVEGTLC